MLDTSLKIKNRPYIKSSSFVMALLFTMLCGAAALSLGFFINYFAKGHLIQSTEAILDAEMRYIEAVGDYRENIKDTANTGQLHIFLNQDGTLPDNISLSISRLAEGIIVFKNPEDNRRYAAKIYTLDDNRKMLIATDITQISKDFMFMQWLGIASICFVMLVVFVAFIISVFVVSGTNKIAQTAHEIIETGDLSRRVYVGSRWDDLSNMASVLNMLLDRVEELMQGVRQVSDNIAHDLRTPLTRMRGKIESLVEGKTKGELLAETDQLLSTFNALLRISRIEAEKQRSQFCEVNLKELLEDVIAFYEPVADNKNITIKFDLSEGIIHGDRDLLFQAYANLIDNAVKFTSQSGGVNLLLTKNNNKTHIEISDNGTGIASDEQEKIFNRFYRGQKSRSSAGVGLGLSLVSAVIKLHGGNIQVVDNNPGLKIITIL